MEHTSVISQLTKEIKEGKKNFAAVWLDPANAYGYVPHKPIESAIELCHIPGNVQKIVKRYFGGIQNRFRVDDVVYHILAERRERDCHRMYNLYYPICNGNGYADQICRKRDKRAKDEIIDLSTTNKRLHGWPHSDNNNSTHIPSNSYTSKICPVTFGR